MLVLLINCCAPKYRFRSHHNLKLADDEVNNLEVTYLVPEDLSETHFLNSEVDTGRIVMDSTHKLRYVLDLSCAGHVASIIPVHPTSTSSS